MLPENIILQSAGSLAVALFALLMFVLQTAFFLKTPHFRRFAWSAALSFSALLYSVGIFLEYNSLQYPLNRFSGLLEWTAIICLIHSLYGLTYSYLGIKSRRYHILAGIGHALVLILLWFTDYLVAEEPIIREFIGLDSPYIEPSLGPLGPYFLIYAVAAAVNAMRIWAQDKSIDPKHRITYLAGMGFWLLLGIHDALAAIGLPTVQYLMEYGFLGFAAVVLWVVFNSYLESAAIEKYRVITELANDCILVIQDGRIVFENAACGRLLGRPLTDPKPGDFLEVVEPEDRQTILRHYNSLMEGNAAPRAFTVRVEGEGGEQRFAEIASSVIQYNNRPALLAVIRDITERKREEAARRESERKLAALRKMESLGLLAGGVAHDLNNVLTGIVSYPDVILTSLPEDSWLRKPIRTIQEAGQRAAAIVEDLLTMARGVAVAKEPLNLNELIREYMESPEYAKLLRFHPSVTVRTELDSDLLSITGSPIHIRKVIMNLVSNASEAFEGRGNVLISTENRYIEDPPAGLENVKKGEYVVLTVSDDGCGIPSQELERIFEPFYTKKVMGRSGTGLGLALVWNVANDHEGHITVTSDDNGTTFELYLPAVRDEAAAQAVSVPISEFSGNGEVILIVDDVESQREILSIMLENLGYSPVCVSSGEEAVEYVREKEVDLILLDMIMDPGMNGRETYEKIIEFRPGQKAIIVSGYAETEDVKDARRMGASQYIKKPVTLERLGVAVKGELERKG